MIKFSESVWFLEEPKRRSRVVIVCPTCKREKYIKFSAIFQSDGALIEGRTTFCTYCKGELVSSRVVGKRFGRLEVVGLTKKGDANFASCRCDCGNLKTVAIGDLEYGKVLSCGCFHLERISGKNCHLYNHLLTDDERFVERKTGIDKWKKAVKERDKNKCQICDATNTLVAHHLDGYKDNPEKALDNDNGITLCRDCHVDFHINFMGGYRKPVTKKDFEDYMEQV